MTSDSVLVELLKEVYDWMVFAPFDYSNGVSYMGIDEGNVLGWEYHRELENKIRQVLEEANDSPA